MPAPAWVENSTAARRLAPSRSLPLKAQFCVCKSLISRKFFLPKVSATCSKGRESVAVGHVQSSCPQRCPQTRWMICIEPQECRVRSTHVAIGTADQRDRRPLHAIIRDRIHCVERARLLSII